MDWARRPGEIASLLVKDGSFTDHKSCAEDLSDAGTVQIRITNELSNSGPNVDEALVALSLQSHLDSFFKQ
jgi:hypothetical protein